VTPSAIRRADWFPKWLHLIKEAPTPERADRTAAALQLQVIVQGRTKMIDACSSTTAAQLEHIVAERVGIDSFGLYYGGRPLHGSASLSNYRITSGATIELKERGRGGGCSQRESSSVVEEPVPGVEAEKPSHNSHATIEAPERAETEPPTPRAPASLEKVNVAIEEPKSPAQLEQARYRERHERHDARARELGVSEEALRSMGCTECACMARQIGVSAGEAACRERTRVGNNARSAATRWETGRRRWALFDPDVFGRPAQSGPNLLPDGKPVRRVGVVTTLVCDVFWHLTFLPISSALYIVLLFSSSACFKCERALKRHFGDIADKITPGAALQLLSSSRPGVSIVDIAARLRDHQPVRYVLCLAAGPAVMIASLLPRALNNGETAWSAVGVRNEAADFTAIIACFMALTRVFAMVVVCRWEYGVCSVWDRMADSTMCQMIADMEKSHTSRDNASLKTRRNWHRWQHRQRACWYDGEDGSNLAVVSIHGDGSGDVPAGKVRILAADGEEIWIRMSDGSTLTLSVKFVDRQDNYEVASYKWRRTVKHGDRQINLEPTSFAVGPEGLWVDWVSHLNDQEQLKLEITHMGELYFSRVCAPQYISNYWDVKDRGWIQQEIMSCSMRYDGFHTFSTSMFALALHRRLGVSISKLGCTCLMVSIYVLSWAVWRSTASWGVHTVTARPAADLWDLGFGALLGTVMNVYITSRSLLSKPTRTAVVLSAVRLGACQLYDESDAAVAGLSMVCRSLGRRVDVDSMAAAARLVYAVTGAMFTSNVAGACNPTGVRRVSCALAGEAMCTLSVRYKWERTVGHSLAVYDQTLRLWVASSLYSGEIAHGGAGRILPGRNVQ